MLWGAVPCAALIARFAGPLPALAQDNVVATATLPPDLSPWGMYLNADPVVKAVLIGLVFASIVTWTVWLAKSIEIFFAKRRVRTTLNKLAGVRSTLEGIEQVAEINGEGAQFLAAGGRERRRHHEEATRVQSPGALMPRTAISGLVCTTFLVLLGFPAAPQEPAGKGADTESGQQTFNNACRTCHTTKEGDNRLGPNLHNIIGRKAGSLQNYGYSSAMKGADFVWDKEKLDRFIAKPDEVVPGNNMKPYGGLTSAEDRAKVIVFLESPATN
jgi:cytochrome c